MSEAVSNPPLSEREMIVQVKTHADKQAMQIGNPIKFKSGHYYAAEGGVKLGFHNEEILTSLGFNRDDIRRLRDAGVIGV